MTPLLTQMGPAAISKNASPERIRLINEVIAEKLQQNPEPVQTNATKKKKGKR
jgi:hypothetical protein